MAEDLEGHVDRLETVVKDLLVALEGVHDRLTVLESTRPRNREALLRSFLGHLERTRSLSVPASDLEVAIRLFARR